MNPNDYQIEIEKFDLYTKSIAKIQSEKTRDEIEQIMVTQIHFTGLAGEVGELGEKIKKAIRDKEASPLLLTPEAKDQDAILKELGDIEWYLTRLEADFGFTKGQVLQANYDKLSKRMYENKIKGEGDNR
jgi:NTP pyrophosphatase (non-canonical NTP hydrolase)